tara:strand:+ start:316 stop:519 length:204 start_codon:yes stop_codon:yes gene_type:complete
MSQFLEAMFMFGVCGFLIFGGGVTTILIYITQYVNIELNRSLRKIRQQLMGLFGLLGCFLIYLIYYS